MGRRQKGGSDDLTLIQLTDFSGGINSMYGAFSLGLNECQNVNTQNVLGFPGRLIYIGGFVQTSGLPTSSVDNAWEFYDGATPSVKHYMVWANGNLYDCRTGSAVLIKSGAYTAGDDVARIDQNGILYYCTKDDALRQFDGTTDSAVASGPKGTYLTAFAGSLILANYTLSGGTNKPGAFVPSNVNDPTTWQSANAQTVGTERGSLISFIMPMGVSAYGVAPSQSMIVGMTAGNMYMYTGAIGSQKESVINCPVGSLDANSAVYIPSNSLLGECIFVGTDANLWVTNGITAEQLTEKNQNYVYGLISNARAGKSTQRFFGTYNDRYGYYLLDLGGNQQLVWRWKSKALWYIKGWPSGAYFRGHNASGFSSNFVAATADYATAGLYQVGQDNATFNGTNPTIQYQSPYIHGGNPEMLKEYQWVMIGSRNDGISYKVTASSLPFPDNTTLTSQALIFTDPVEGAGALGIWDQGKWDKMVWGADYNTSNLLPGVQHGMLSVAAIANQWTPAGTVQPLRSGAVAFTVSWYNDGKDVPNFDLITLQTRFRSISMLGAGGLKYDPQAGVAYTTDNFMGNQST